MLKGDGNKPVDNLGHDVGNQAPSKKTSSTARLSNATSYGDVSVVWEFTEGTAYKNSVHRDVMVHVLVTTANREYRYHVNCESVKNLEVSARIIAQIMMLTHLEGAVVLPLLEEITVPVSDAVEILRRALSLYTTDPIHVYTSQLEKEGNCGQ